ncbi:hypothetical protein ATANTOWER_032734 [Ataeniobius toweri]|uniref:Secreted protein n=1 Tax=Ataeniobius toweri TaxID=208326 RepID=A0ABU7ANG4_9TELE|nr:hypothetical protein [Ataeniobius toweri]
MMMLCFPLLSPHVFVMSHSFFISGPSSTAGLFSVGSNNGGNEASSPFLPNYTLKRRSGAFIRRILRVRACVHLPARVLGEVWVKNGAECEVRTFRSEREFQKWTL